MSIELLDDLEAGELSIEFESEPPETLIAWAIERFSPRLSISTAFQTDGAVLLHMAYAIDPAIRLFSVDTGRLPQETYELIEQMRDRYPNLQLDLLSPDADAVGAMVKRHGPNLFYRSVENRLLCCQIRKVQPLQRHLGGLDAWITGLRRDQWATRSDIRKVEIDHDHGAIVKLNPLADWTEDEISDYVREHELPYNALYERGTPRSAAPLAPGRPRRAKTSAPVGGGGRRTLRRSAASIARSRPAASSTSSTPCSAITPPMTDTVTLQGEAREVALAEAQTVHSMVRDDEMRARVAELLAAIDEGEVGGDPAELLESVLELGLQTGRVRAYYGPGGEQAALATLRRLPHGRLRSDSAREVTSALRALRGAQLDGVRIAAVAPGAFTIAIEAGGIEASIRLDATGARLVSLGT